MKKRMIIALLSATAPFLGFAQIDDMYYVPSKKTTSQNSGTSSSSSSSSSSYSYALADEDTYDDEEVNYAGSNVRDVDEYNRRSSWTGEYEDEYAADDSIYYEEDAESEYDCSKRILRFCTPTVGVAVSSPYYWDLCYGPDAIYWDVYDDGVYAYVFPCSWSYVYWDPYYSLAWTWGWTWGAAYWSWWGYPWFGWYGGWRPHHYYGWHGWGGRHYAGGRNLRYRQTNPIARSTRANSRYATRINGNSRSVSGATSRGSARSSVSGYTRSSSRSSSFTRSSSSSRSFSSPSRSSSFRSGGGSRGGVSRGGGGRR